MDENTLVQRIEEKLPDWDKWVDAQQKHFADTILAAESKKIESRKQASAESGIDHSFGGTRHKLDSLLIALGKNHVTEPNAGIGAGRVQEALDLCENIYQKAMITLRLSRLLVASEHPELKAVLNDHHYDFSLQTHSHNLQRKIEAHFILGEMYNAVGVRLHHSILDMGAKAEYEKVIKEGKEQYTRLKDTQPGLVMRAKLSYYIATSYLRLLGITEDHRCRKEARAWFGYLFDAKILLNGHEAHILATDFEFKRYLKDIKEVKMPCMFQKMQQMQPDFDCGRYTSPLCPYNHDGKCAYKEGTDDAAMVRYHFQRDWSLNHFEEKLESGKKLKKD